MKFNITFAAIAVLAIIAGYLWLQNARASDKLSGASNQLNSQDSVIDQLQAQLEMHQRDRVNRLGAGVVTTDKMTRL